MNKKIKLLLIASMLLTFLLTACGKEELSGLEKIRDENKIVIGTSPDYPPFEFIYEGEIVGIDMELAKYLSKELGVEFEIKQMDFSNLINAIETGMVDIVLAGMNPSEENKKGADFTDLYYESDFSILVKKPNKSISKIEDLKGKKVGVQMGTTQERMMRELNGVEVISLVSNPDIVMNLKSNKIDAAVMESPVTLSFESVNDDIEVVKGLEIKDDTGGMGIATRKGNKDLIDELNQIIAKAKEKGLIDQWFIKAEKLNRENIQNQ